MNLFDMKYNCLALQFTHDYSWIIKFLKHLFLYIDNHLAANYRAFNERNQVWYQLSDMMHEFVKDTARKPYAFQ